VKQEETESWPRIYWGPSGHPQYASIQAKNVPHSADSVQHPLKFPLLLRAKLHQTDFVQDPKWSLKRPLQITAERLADPGARAHACNLSYSGGRDQEHCSLKPAWANSLWDPISKNPITKIRLVEWLKMKALSSSPSTAKQRKPKTMWLWLQIVLRIACT
jgi:hypothetical protein